MFFRQLSEPEKAEFRTWARENYKSGDPIEGIWHPEIQAECVKINLEKAVMVKDPPICGSCTYYGSNPEGCICPRGG